MRYNRFWTLLAILLAPAFVLAAAKPCCADHVALEFQTALGGDGEYGRFYVNYAGSSANLLPPGPEERTASGVRVPVSGFGQPVPPLVYHATQQGPANAGDLKELCLSHPLSCTLSSYGLAGGEVGELDLYQAGSENDHRLTTSGLPGQ
jgi:hypothetical protein